MLAKAIDKIIELTQPLTVEINGSEYSTKNLQYIDKESRADRIEVSTLSGLVAYIKHFQNDMKGIPYLINIVSPTRVDLLSSLDSDRKREMLLTAQAHGPKIPFNCYIGHEEMLIALQSMFIDDPETDRAALMRFAGTVTSGSITAYDDDGITQKATIKLGIASKAEAIVPSPCVLRPYRTFSEVEQPASSFIFRLRELAHESVEAALFEADGGAWKVDAMEAVYSYLERELRGSTNVTIIF